MEAAIVPDSKRTPAIEPREVAPVIRTLYHGRARRVERVIDFGIFSVRRAIVAG